MSRSSQARLRRMDFCAGCHHGHAAHHNGIGACFGERKLGEGYVDCDCDAFVRQPPEEPDA